MTRLKTKVFVIAILFFIQVEFSNPLLLLFKNKKNKYDPFSFQRQSDQFGQFEYRNGRKTYLYCFDVRCDPKFDCRSPGFDHSLQVDNDPNYRDNDVYYHHHHYHHGGHGGWNSFQNDDYSNVSKFSIEKQTLKRNQNAGQCNIWTQSFTDPCTFPKAA